MSNPQAELLRQLSIDRGAPPPEPRPKWPWLVAALVVIAAVVALLFGRGGKAPEVRAVTAIVKESGGASGGSVLDASGYVVARRQATVSSKVTGKVTEIRFEEGQAVREGEVLARIDDSNVRTQLTLAEAQTRQAQAQLQELEVSLANARRDAGRNRDLLARKLVSQAAVDNADTAVAQFEARLASAGQGVTVAREQVAVYRQQLDDTVVRAPFAGIITVKNAQPGEMISPLSAGGAGTRTGLGTLVDMESLEVEVDVSENFINRVQPGQPVSARLNAYPDWEIPCAVVAVIPTADRSKATVKVRVGFQLRDARILPDMGVRVAFREAAKPAGETAAPVARVLVPSEAIQVEGERGIVFVLSGKQVERRAVRVAGQGPEGVRVASGLAGGESLAVSDFSTLSDGIEVKVLP